MIRTAKLTRDYQDVPAGTLVFVINRFYGGVEGRLLVHVEPHPTDANCDWSWLCGVDERHVEYHIENRR